MFSPTVTQLYFIHQLECSKSNLNVVLVVVVPSSKLSELDLLNQASSACVSLTVLFQEKFHAHSILKLVHLFAAHQSSKNLKERVQASRCHATAFCLSPWMASTIQSANSHSKFTLTRFTWPPSTLNVVQFLVEHSWLLVLTLTKWQLKVLKLSRSDSKPRNKLLTRKLTTLATEGTRTADFKEQAALNSEAQMSSARENGSALKVSTQTDSWQPPFHT